MGDNDHQLVYTLINLGAIAAPLVGILFLGKIIVTAEKGMGRLFKGMQGAVSKAGDKASGLGTKLAKNSAPGQAAQEYMNTRRAATKIKGQEMYRKAGNRFPFLNMSQTQRQLFDAQNMKNYQEEVGRARGMTSLNVARAFGNVGSNNSVDPATGRQRYDPNAGLSGANLAQIKKDKGYWHHDPDSGKSSFIAFTQEDMNSLDRLETAGFLKGGNNRAGATAAMDELFDQNFVESRDIQNLARTAGQDPESSALMTNSIRVAAGRNRYKNYQYGHVVNGAYSKYVESPKTKDDVSIVQSGTAGVPKEVYEDRGIQAGIAHRIKVSGASGDDATIKNTLTDLARQTGDVNKPAIIQQIAQASGMDEKDFITLRQAIQTNTLSSAEAQAALTTAVGQIKANNLRGFQNAQVKAAAKQILGKRQAAQTKDPFNKGAQDDVDEVKYFSTL